MSYRVSPVPEPVMSRAQSRGGLQGLFCLNVPEPGWLKAWQEPRCLPEQPEPGFLLEQPESGFPPAQPEPAFPPEQLEPGSAREARTEPLLARSQRPFLGW